MTSTKFFDDVHFSNASWAKIVGIPLRELNNAEMVFLQSLGYKINIKNDILQMWSEWITRFADENPIQVRGSSLKQEGRESDRVESKRTISESTDSAIEL
mmetsp:Transcript_24410/g.27067  ORF Transcript_24410/g.27067 Transcript_24410/m.27067 type:complete len:100 (-) Transcript_24410:357-656(-)|eukprot:CAMPEP_0205800010 /NCGR_PEP_ID=MMETSP0205-20121125/1511_1 /ASSEMBLY_ACC=CAM_ASM_000278 /TAXON_ID=36767 /ORGANISM="Euplotes focardii, Strain TN1" /LENGTH=99 /DNA_ID=CAMNT_0053062355 /DNA_START=343 /DNA_END=642 /DNA_ORIENTATION=+